MKLYKVLVNGKSCHGGDHVWSLPTLTEAAGQDALWTPGGWNTFKGNMVLCSAGLHVTSNPSLWWKDGCVVYEVEVDGPLGGKDEYKSKFVYSRVRLMQSVTMINIGGGWQIKQDENKSSGWSDPVKK